MWSSEPYFSLGKYIHNFCPTGTEVNRQIEMGHHWCPINFGPLGQKLHLRETGHHYLTSAPVEPKLREKEIFKIQFDYATRFDKEKSI